MSARVVCISRTLASGGEPVGQAVANHLQFRFVDDEIIVKAAAQLQVDPEEVARAEQKQPLLTRLMDSLRTTAPVATARKFLAPEPMHADYYLRAPSAPKSEKRTDVYRDLIREVIQQVALEGDVVIMGHAASMALPAEPGTLRVLVTASRATRIQRLLVPGTLLNDANAESAVDESDQARLFYFQQFYGLNEELPTHYDLVVNTDVLTPEQAVQMIVHAAQA